jgi:PAS domain S-box-containing protein
VIEQLDLDTAIKLSQAVSGEIVREKVIDTFMRTAVEHAGAERGLLVLMQGVDQLIEAEAQAEKSPGSERVTVRLRQANVTPGDLPESLFHHVVRTQGSVVLGDASAQNPFSSDDYIRQNHARSVLCLPLVKQGTLIGVLYLENNLTPHAFTSAQVGVLKLLASQAAISLENANLYSDLQRREAAIRASEKSLRLMVDTIPGFVCTLSPAGEVELLNRQVLDYFGKTPEDLKNWSTSDAVHPDDLPRVIEGWRHSVETGQPHDLELRQQRADGEYRWFHSRALPARDKEGRITGWYMLLTDIDDRRKAEEELRRSKAYLTEAQRLSRTGSFGCKFSSGEMFWSEETFGIFGYNRATTPGMEAILERVHPQDKARVQEHMHRAASEGKGCDLEYRLVMPDDSIKHVHVVAHAAKDEPGQFEFVGAVMDVTAAKESEERIRQDERELRRSEAYLAEAQRLTHTGSFARNVAAGKLTDSSEEHSLTHSSEEHSRLFGFDPERGIPSSEEFRERIHPEDRDSALKKFERAVAERTDVEVDFRTVLPDGTTKFLHAISHPVFDAAGDLVEYVGTVMDVTERKQAEETLRRSESYLAEAQRLTHTGSWALNVATGEPTHSSEEHLRLLGFDPERDAPSELEFRQRVHPEDRDRVVETMDRAICERTDFEADFRIVLPDGTIKYLHAIGHPVFTAAGDLVEYMGTSWDVTERKSAEDALLKAQSELAHVTRVATLGEMTASISHEINQPLGAMVNNANACLRWLAASKLEEARQSAMLIAADGYRAGEIIARIRALAQKAPPRKDWLDINQTIHEVITLARSEVQGNRVSLKTRLGRNVPPILGDRIQLQQVLLNLMMNAIEAMRGVDEGVPRELWVDSEKVESTNVLVAVRDSGPGLDAGSFDRLFETFYTTKPEGLGMGLAISRSIIEAHGGRLWATANAPHGGAVFQFTLPIASERSS